MSLAKTTLGISRALEGIAAGRPGRRGFLTLLLFTTAVFILAIGMLMLTGQPMTPVMGIGGLVAGIVMFSLMVVRHEWLIILALTIGHTIFYGRLGQTLGMRIKDSFGPSDLLFVLAFVAGSVYWMGVREKPNPPKPIVWPPLALFVYTSGYILLAFFFWDRQDNALLQATGWLYFSIALPVYLCLTTGRVWKPFFLLGFCSMLLGAFLSSTIEAGKLTFLVQETGYGGAGYRSFGDLSVKTNMLGLTIITILTATVIAGYAKTRFWQIASVLAGTCGAVVVFLDRGRIHYAGLTVALIVVLAFMPTIPRLRAMFRYFVFVLVAILTIEAGGGEFRTRFNDAVDKAWTRVQLARADAITADQGLTLRQNLVRQAQAIFNENPLFGGGPGVRFGKEMRWQEMEEVPIAFIDNSWMYPLAVGGLVGMSLILLCYFSMSGACVVAYLKLRNPLHRSLALVPIAMFVFLLICSPVTWWLVDRFHVAAFAVSVAMVLSLVYHEKMHGSDEPVVRF
jgi:hypothetical protein